MRRGVARVRTAVARKALRTERGRLGIDRRTAMLGVVAAGSVATVVAAEVGRVWRRGSAPMPSEADDLIQAAEEAVVETVEAALAGYQDMSPRENATFMLLTSFVTTFASARGIAYLLRGRGTVGPFRDLVVGRRHIHHFVPGIAILMVSGSAAILTRDEGLEPKLALAFGSGMGLTLDESALLLSLEDVYWTPEGLVGVQITLATAAGIAALALGLRFVRRGERIVLEVDGSGGRHGVAAVGFERRLKSTTVEHERRSGGDRRRHAEGADALPPGEVEPSADALPPSEDGGSEGAAPDLQ
jgi:hypothetical protein